MTSKAYLKANPEKYILCGTIDGIPVFIAPQGLSGINTTCDQSKAELWDSLSNTAMRLSYFKAATGITDLSFQLA